MDLFSAYQLGPNTLKNRVVMAPMTRSRRPDAIAGEDTALYYSQRAGAGLIVTEGTFVSEEAQGYVYVPGLWNTEQTEGWKHVTSAVHAADGTIFCQLWHVGRMSHASLQPNNGAPVSSTARAPRCDYQAYAVRSDGSVGFVEATPPRQLATDEVGRMADDFARAARNAKLAGFDGVEVHGANGYLFEQFLNPHVNDRDDIYGGSIQSRSRALLETTDRVLEEMGEGRVGVRLSPFSQVSDMPPYDEAREQYLYLAAELGRRPIAYVHIADNLNGGERLAAEFLEEFRGTLGTTLILAGGMTRDLAIDYVDRGVIDLAAFGQPYIANPDLAERLELGAELSRPDRATYYGGGPEGYTDYPVLQTQTTPSRDGSTIAG